MSATFSVYPKVFPLQTYFSNAAAEQGLLVQSRGNGVVLADRQPDVRGTFVGLQPDSQTPVAFRPLGVDQRGGGQTILLVPGQVVRIDVAGFEWGLPFGWLGGGLATLVVANNKDAFLNWPQQKVEVMLQRFRMAIQADAAPGALTFKSAMPNRFPWPNALRTPSTSQAGQPLLAPEHTKLALRLRVNNLAAPSDMRILFAASDDLDTGADGVTVGTADLSYVDVSFPMAAPGAAAVAYPLIEVSLPARLGGDITQIAFVALTAALAGSYVDVIRYGKI